MSVESLEMGSLLNANSIKRVPVTRAGEVMARKCCEILACTATFGERFAL